MTFYLLLSILLFSIGLLFLVISLKEKKENKIIPNNISNPQFAILIPARDESKVIEDLLKSIKNQTRKVKMSDVFVIVESSLDPTILICKKYHASIIIRKHLEKKSKGYALQEAIEYLCSLEKYYDAYFIFDADNILDKHYLEEMEKDFHKGYDISTGYRNIKNGNENALAASAGLTYWIINEYFNKKALQKGRSLMLSGTGFYLHGKYIKQWKTYPFHSLTEDVELSFYANNHNLSMNYNPKAIFFDEQPSTFKQSIKQRKRWIKGYFQNQKKAFQKNKSKKNIHIYNILIIICFIFALISLLLALLTYSFIIFLIAIILIYFLLAYLTYIILKTDKKLCINKKVKNKTIWYHPIYLISYLYAFVLSFIQRNTGWEKIEHGSIDKK